MSYSYEEVREMIAQQSDLTWDDFERVDHVQYQTYAERYEDDGRTGRYQLRSAQAETEPGQGI